MTTDEPTAVAVRRDPASVLLARCAVVTGLAALAIAQPVLDLFGSNPAFFVFKRADDASIVLFGAVVALGVPLALAVVEAAAWAVPRPVVGRVVHHGLVAALGGTYGLVVARQVADDSDAVALLLLLVVGAAVAVAESRVRAVHLAGRYLALAAPAFLLLFLFASPVGTLLWSDEAEAVDAGVGSTTPIVMVVLDELPLSSLLDAQGDLDEQRFPGFARLAAGSTWYRNGAANAPGTMFSVPATLTGELPDIDSIPTSVDHPRNLFTLLGGTYDLKVHEEITALCPTSLCEPGGDTAIGEPGGDVVVDRTERSTLGHLRSMGQDLWVVGRHLVLPPSLREDLPALDTAWGGFLGQDVVSEPEQIIPVDGDVDATTSDPTAAFLARAFEGRAALAQGDRLQQLAAAARPTGRPTLWFTHAVLPHQPWELTERGTRYSLSSELVGMREGRWADDERAVLQGFQRHLLQVGYADREIGLLVDSLQASGLWDEAVVIVVADHGVAFAPTELLRKPVDATEDELYRVPMFLHLPGQTEGRVDERDAMLFDLVPTLVDLLDIDVDWTFDGRSLLLDDPAPRPRPVVYTQGPTELAPGTDGLEALARRNAGWVGAGWSGTYAAGPLAPNVGRAVSELAPERRDVTWLLEQAPLVADLDPDGGFVPVLLTGDADEPHEEGWFLVALDGVVAGTGFVGDDGRFSALAQEDRFHAGAVAVQLLVPDGEGGWWSPTLPDVEAASITFDGAVGGTATTGDGRTLPITGTDDDHLVRVDRAVVEGGVLAVGGWSLDLRGAVPEQVLLVADGVPLPTSVRRIERADLALFYEDDLYLGAGFELVVTGVQEVPTTLAVASVYDDVVVWRPVQVTEPD